VSPASPPPRSTTVSSRHPRAVRARLSLSQDSRLSTHQPPPPAAAGPHSSTANAAQGAPPAGEGNGRRGVGAAGVACFRWLQNGCTQLCHALWWCHSAAADCPLFWPFPRTPTEQLSGIDELRVAGERCGTEHDVYCVASAGHQTHRTRLVENTASPHWNEVGAFAAAAAVQPPCGCGWCSRGGHSHARLDTAMPQPAASA
jgi:hypothetical protein